MDFDDDMTLAQRKAFVVLAFHTMVADHKAVAEEHALVDALEERLGVAGQISAQEFFGTPDVSLFNQPDQRVAVIAKLYQIAIADGRFHVNERTKIHELGVSFGLSDDVVESIRTWVETPAEQRGKLPS